ncbi:MAG: toll/interleukin-1 receptor domain-containing protein [Anaerolineae bacterium]
MSDPDHLALFTKCARAKDYSEWNTWRQESRTDNRNLHPDLGDADLRGADLIGADLGGVILHGANLVNADLSGVVLRAADLRAADFRGANLYRADFSAAALTNANLGGAILFEALLPRADLSGANLSRADLGGAVLRGASLYRADLGGAVLRGANLCEAVLNRANLTNADLREADLEQATLGDTTFAIVDLSTVKGLEAVIHKAPSIISIDTLYLSGGNIPQAFLGGCGVPDSMITFSHSLVGKATEFYSCSINYSSQDQELAERLRSDLQAQGIRVWLAPKDMPTGAPLGQEIDGSIRPYDKVLVLLSENSLGSKWVDIELATAADRESRERRTILFPIRIDNAAVESRSLLANILRSHRIVDLQWQAPEAYQESFERLLHELQPAME